MKEVASAIILAGGSGTRFGHEGGKMLVDIMGMPMLTRSIMAFDNARDVGEIILVCPKSRQEEYMDIAVEPYNFNKPIKIVESGELRQESAFKGLEAVADEYKIVAVHDGARPHATTETINHVINEVKGNYEIDGAVVGFPSIDTMKVIEDGLIAGTPERSALFVAQTPQVFRKDIYRKAHFAALNDGFVGTDDSSLVERLGAKILPIVGKRDNIKLTQPEDLAVLASAVINEYNKGVDKLNEQTLS